MLGAVAQCTSGAGWPPDEALRPGTRRDVLALSWLIEMSDLTHWPTGQETLRELLSRECSLVWLCQDRIRAALIYSLRRLPVATARVLMLRARAEQGAFFQRILPAMEQRIAVQCALWLSFYRCEEWLAQGLLRCGYQLQDQVVHYHKRDLQAPIEGNREILIRPATVADEDSLLQLDARCFEPFWRLNAEIVRCALDASPYVLVAEEGGMLVGYLMAERWAEEGYISRVAVWPQARGRGIGTRLLVQVLGLMQGDGLRGARLNTQEDNLEARAVYERLGFALEGASDPVWAKMLPGPDGVKK